MSSYINMGIGEMEHTPTPWEVFGHGRLLVIAPEAGWSVFEIENPYPTELPIHEANAAFIVRAVNSHDDLVATLQWLRDNYAAGRTLEINERIDAALAMATA